jgi:hypothetical protein
LSFSARSIKTRVAGHVFHGVETLIDQRCTTGMNERFAQTGKKRILYRGRTN